MIFYTHFHHVMTRKNVMGVYLHKGLRCDKVSAISQGDSEEEAICIVLFIPEGINYKELQYLQSNYFTL